MATRRRQLPGTGTEAQIQRTILDGLAAKGIFSFRINTGGFGGSHKGKRWFVRPHSLGAGCADILAFPVMKQFSACQNCDERYQEESVYPTWIECKTDKGELSAEQASFRLKVTALGHGHLVARSWDDVQKYLDDLDDEIV